MTEPSPAHIVAPIHAPGARLLASVPFRFFTPRGALLGSALATMPPLVPLIDALLGVVLFLLAHFAPAATCAERQRVPRADNGIAMVEAPVVAVTERAVMVDGSATDATAGLVEPLAPPRALELKAVLKNKRELWRQLHPDEAFPGVVVLQVERQLPAIAVKRVVQAAAAAGYPNVSFLVHDRGTRS
jgi:hypothetical protein